MKMPFDDETANEMFSYMERMVSVHGCDNSLRFAEKWLRDVKHLPEQQVKDVLEFLDSNGGCCDCDAIMYVWILRDAGAAERRKKEEAGWQPIAFSQ